MQHQGEADAAAHRCPHKGNGRYWIISPGQKGRQNGITNPKPQGNQIPGVARHIDEKILHTEPLLVATDTPLCRSNDNLV